MVSKYDADVVAARVREENSFDSAPRITYEDEKVKIKIMLFPLDKKNRDPNRKRCIASYPSNIFWGGSEEMLKDSIRKKASRYGNLDKPYIICINSTSYKGTNHFDAFNSLFGSIQVSWSTNPNDRDEKITRAQNGLFYRANKPQHTRVSAIFITQININNLHVANHWMIEHPFPKNRIDLSKIGMQHHGISEKKILEVPGLTISEILKIPNNWPS